MSIRELAKFLLLGLIVFVLNTTVLRGTSLDLLMLYSVLGALRWDTRGGLTAGIWSGFLAGSISATPLSLVVFYYALIGYLSALILDSTVREGIFQKLAVSLLLTGLSSIAAGALFWRGSLPSLHFIESGTLLGHAGLLLCLMELESRFATQGKAVARRILR